MIEMDKRRSQNERMMNDIKGLSLDLDKCLRSEMSLAELDLHKRLTWRSSTIPEDVKITFYETNIGLLQEVINKSLRLIIAPDANVVERFDAIVGVTIRDVTQIFPDSEFDRLEELGSLFENYEAGNFDFISEAEYAQLITTTVNKILSQSEQ
jgi:hypothetical protein